MVVNDKQLRKDAKLIVNIPSEDLDILETASKIENRKRNNFVLTSALKQANKIISEATIPAV